MCSKYQQAMIDAYAIYNNYATQANKALEDEVKKIRSEMTDATRGISEVTIIGLKAITESSIAAAKNHLDGIIDLLSAEAKKEGEAHVQ